MKWAIAMLACFVVGLFARDVLPNAHIPPVLGSVTSEASPVASVATTTKKPSRKPKAQKTATERKDDGPQVPDVDQARRNPGYVTSGIEYFPPPL